MGFFSKNLPQICSDTHKQLAAAQYNRLPMLAGSSSAGCVCCLGRKDVAHSLSELHWDMNHIATVGNNFFFYQQRQLSRKTALFLTRQIFKFQSAKYVSGFQKSKKYSQPIDDHVILQVKIKYETHQQRS